MKCPHCNKEVFGRCHDVDDLYEEPKELTPLEKSQEENEGLKQKIERIEFQNRQLEESLLIWRK